MLDFKNKNYCRYCKNFVKAYSPCPGESWERCKVKLLSGEIKYKQDNISLEYCGNLNKNNNCKFYKEKLIVTILYFVWPSIYKKDEERWWMTYY